MFNQSPLETLASFAITFVAGAASVGLIVAYGQWMKTQGTRQSAAMKTDWVGQRFPEFSCH